MSRTMRAVVANAGRCVLQSVPPPVAAPGEALITVAATALNRADTLQRKGLYPPPPGVWLPEPLSGAAERPCLRVCSPPAGLVATGTAVRPFGLAATPARIAPP